MAQSFADSDWKQSVFASISPLNKYRRFCKYQVILLFAAVRQALTFLARSIISSLMFSSVITAYFCVADRFVVGELFYISLILLHDRQVIKSSL